MAKSILRGVIRTISVMAIGLHGMITASSGVKVNSKKALVKVKGLFSIPMASYIMRVLSKPEKEPVSGNSMITPVN